MRNNLIQLFEHQALRIEDKFGEFEFGTNHLEALARFNRNGDLPYYTLINKGVKFHEYVGAIQVGNLLIEVLPKADRGRKVEENTGTWQKILIGMYKAVGLFEVRATSQSSLALKPNTILELYFNLFIDEVESLVRAGLIRQYRREEGNRKALKGKLLFSKQISRNFAHQERFYIRHVVYTREHIWHIIIQKAIRIILDISSNTAIHNRIGALNLSFPEMPDANINALSFDKLRYTRKTEAYRKAMEIARLLILNYHPDVKSGANNVLALMFDMNALWERFVYVSLRKCCSADPKHNREMRVQATTPFWEEKRASSRGAVKPVAVLKVSRGCIAEPGTDMRAQARKLFWKEEKGSLWGDVKPDIVIKYGSQNMVWDTKWKLPKELKPAPGDLQQLFAYAKLFEADKVALVYPGPKDCVTGCFKIPNEDEKTKLSIICIPPPANDDIKKWQESIYKSFKDWQKSVGRAAGKCQCLVDDSLP